MNHCLLCHQLIREKTSWSSFLQLEQKSDPICSTCEQNLEKITGEICLVCGRPLADLPPKRHHNQVCYDCQRWEEHQSLSGVLSQNRSIYLYNDFMKETLARFKFRGDYMLVYAFKKAFQETFQQFDHSSFVIAPIPLSHERLYERGFNQSEALAALLEQPIHSLLERPHLEKQSKKSRSQRIHSENIFSLKKSIEIEGKHILLIDDIYTTGTTLRHAAATFKKANVASVSSLTLIRG